MRALLISLLIVAALFWFAPGIFAALLAGIVGLTVSGLVAVFLVGGVMLLVGLVFGSTLLALIAGGVAVLFVGFSLLWPLLLVFLVIWLITRDRTQQA